MASTIISPEIWASGLAERLDKPQNWKETCDVIYTDSQTFVLPYVSAANEPAVTSSFMANAAARNTLSNVIPLGIVTMATETLQIVSTENVSMYVSRADLAQQSYLQAKNIGTLLGKKVGEKIESLVLANAASQTNFGDTGGGVLGLASTAITITDNNVDEVIDGVIEQIYTANGFDLYKENGGFIEWRPQDWTKVVRFMKANGFSSADAALNNGGKIGIEWGGLFHYVSTQHTAGHLFAGVRKIVKLGLLASTFGKINEVKNPASSTAGYMPGSNFDALLDYGFKTQTNVAGLVFDVNVN